MISTMILGATAAVFVTMLNDWNSGGKRQRTLQAAQTTADLIERYLRSVVPPGSGNVIFRGEDLSTDDGYGHRLTFLSAAQGRFPRASARSDASEIEFSFDPADGHGMTMRIDASPDDKPDEGGERLALSPLIRSFRVLYYDGTDWAGEWSSGKLPQAVEFRFAIGEDDNALDAAGNPTPTEEISRLVWMPLGGLDQSSLGAATPTQNAPPPDQSGTGTSNNAGTSGDGNSGTSASGGNSSGASGGSSGGNSGGAMVVR